MKVSVVMSSYNHGPFVREAIQSVIDQGFTDWEFIIRDDGSSDDTVQVIQSFRDERIRYLGSGPNLGGAESLNQCVRETRGEYVAQLDANPQWAAVFSYADIIDEHGTLLTSENSSHGYLTIFHETNRDRKSWLRRFLKAGNCLCHPSVLIRRACYDDVGLYDSIMRQLPDFEMWVRVCAKYDIHIHTEPLLKFRILQREGNTSAINERNNARIFFEFLQVLELYTQAPILEQLPEVFPEEFANAKPGEKPLEVLARLLLKVDNPGHQMLAMECLRKASNARGAEASPLRKELVSLYNEARPFGNEVEDLRWKNQDLRRERDVVREANAKLWQENGALREQLSAETAKHADLKARLSDVDQARKAEKKTVTQMRNVVNAWNESSWFRRAFHKLRLP